MMCTPAFRSLSTSQTVHSASRFGNIQSSSPLGPPTKPSTEICICRMRSRMTLLLELALLGEGVAGGRLAHGLADGTHGTHFHAAHARRRDARGDADGVVQVARVDEIEPGELLLGFG